MNPKVKIALQLLLVTSMLGVVVCISYMLIDSIRHAPERAAETVKHARFEMHRVAGCCGDLYMLIDKQTGRHYLRDFRGAIIEVEPTKP